LEIFLEGKFLSEMRLNWARPFIKDAQNISADYYGKKKEEERQTNEKKEGTLNMCIA
jgi:hypothetical protein